MLQTPTIRDTETTTLPAELFDALRAIAEPSRARVIALLGHGEHCVCDVGGALGLSTALVSHHLRVLRASGLLRERHAGRWVYYSLDLERVAQLRGALDALLTPSDEAATTCLCSDCGATQATGALSGPALPGAHRIEVAP
ncbi:MAG: ArsR/SmtB family transcription factor [Candidatus Limnocylindrales bacterium]